MGCSCHGKNGVAVGRTSPYDQCTACAKKHIIKAWSLFNEFTDTDDNRDAMTGQLRLAAAPLMYDHAETARLARDLAVMLEGNRDVEIGDRWEWAMDTDFSEATSYKLQADNTAIAVAQVTDEIDGDEYGYTIWNT